MKKNTLNYPSSNISKIFNNSQLALEDNTQNSFFCKSKEISNKNKNLPTPLISSYISSGIPKQLIHKQMQYDSQLNFESSEKSKLIKTNDDKKGFLSKNSERKQEKKVTLKENIPISNIMYNESESRKMLN